MTPFDLHPEEELEFVKKTINIPTIGNPRTYTHITKNGDQLGTPAYMSPEQIKNTHDADCRSDIFSLGITL
jgi:serine/threonine protein kinase